MTHVVRKWFASATADPERVLASLDLENAFYTLDRQEILSATRELLPSLAPWVDWTYGNTSHLFLDKEIIPSQRGVQQGDPLGPLLFSLALHRAILKTVHQARLKCGAP